MSAEERSEEEVRESSLEVVTALAKLPEGAFVFESDLAHIFRKCQMSIKRAVERGELPKPIRFMG